MGKLRAPSPAFIGFLGIVWVLIGILLILAIWTLSQGAKDNSHIVSEREDLFRREFLAAHQTEDVDSLLELFFLGETTVAELSLLRMALLFEVDLPIAGFLFSPITSRFDFSPYYDAERQRLSLEPIAEVQVIYDTEDRYTASYLLGIKEGRYRIIFAQSLN